MTEPPIDTANFSGPGAVFAIILAMVRWDAWNSPQNSVAYKSAMQFLEGEVCEHTLCRRCGDLANWETSECHIKQRDDEMCFDCWHPLSEHYVAEFDWEDWRDLVASSIGMDPRGYAAAVLAGRAE